MTASRDPNAEIPESAPTAEAPGNIERLFREHNAALLRFIAARIGSEHEAREIAQEAYVHLLQLNHPETVSYLRAYLFKTASNLVVDRLRQRGRRNIVTSTADLNFAPFELTPERQVSGQQSLDLMDAVIAGLSPKCRQAFLLRRVDGLPATEIADRMQIGVNMVRRYIAHALDVIRERLDTDARRNGGATE